MKMNKKETNFGAEELKNKIRWCCRQKEGIRIIDPNENLCREYLKEADDTLDGLALVRGKWKLIMAYYACYNALYSLLLKAGIKSEIHSCSIAVMAFIEGFDENDMVFMEKLKDDRINVQYYLKKKELDDETKVKDFVLKCKQIGEKLDIEKLRERIRRINEKN